MATRKRRKRFGKAKQLIIPQITDADIKKYLVDELAERARQFLIFNPPTPPEDPADVSFVEEARDTEKELQETISAVILLGHNDSINLDTLGRMYDRHEAFHSGGVE